MRSVRFEADRRRGRGQTLVEFALIVPVLFVFLFGLLDAGLLMFSVGTARYAAGDGSKLAAALGNAATTDSQVLADIRSNGGQTSLFTVTEVDIYKLNQDGNGNLTPDPTKYNRYLLDGTPLITPEPWPSSARNVSAGSSDFLGLTIKFTYQWKAGFFAPLGQVQTSATYYVRLEPQSL